MKGDYCNINGFEPSSRTIDAIKEMNRITDMASYLERILTFVPIFQIFAGRDTYALANVLSLGRQVSTSDWDTFADALKGVGLIKRGELERIAMQTADLSMGAEREFWTCVYNAL